MTKKLLIIFLAGTVSGVISVQNWSSFDNVTLTIGVTIVLWYIMWLGNQWVAWGLDQNISWVKNPTLRFITGFLSHFVYSAVALWIFAIIFYKFFGIDIGYKNTFLITISITLFIALFFYSLDFLKRYRTHFAREKELESRLVMAQYNALKNQVNPHFLFNSLNTLNDLLYTNTDIASKFIAEMSCVFRYVLDSNKTDLVEDKEELEFVKSYLYLQKQRFSDGLVYEIYSQPTHKKIPPLSIYMLVENAIKHNVVALKKPLKIKISASIDSICVSNNVNIKDIPIEEKNSLGLKNLKERYSFLGNKEIIIRTDNDCFTVTLPLL